MIIQFSSVDDVQLNRLDSTIEQAKAEEEAAKKRFDEAWKLVYEVFDRNGLFGKPARFITESGMTLARQITNPDEVLSVDMLQTIGATQIPNWMKIWTSITDPGERVVNQTKLAKAIKSGKIPADAVTASMVKPKGVVSRNRRKASKEDIEFMNNPVAAALAEREKAG